MDITSPRELIAFLQDDEVVTTALIVDAYLQGLMTGSPFSPRQFTRQFPINFLGCLVIGTHASNSHHVESAIVCPHETDNGFLGIAEDHIREIPFRPRATWSQLTGRLVNDWPIAGFFRYADHSKVIRHMLLSDPHLPAWQIGTLLRQMIERMRRDREMRRQFVN